MKSPLAQFLDDLFLAAAIFLLAFLVALYFVDALYLCVIVAVVVTMGITLLLRLHRKKHKQTQEDSAQAQLLMTHFLLRPDDYALTFCHNALSKRYQTTLSDGYLRIKDTVVVPTLNTTLTLKTIVNFYALALKVKAKTIVFLSFSREKFPFEVSERLTDLRLELLDGIKIYQLFKDLGALPKAEKPIKKHRFQSFVANALSPKRARAYLFTMFALLFSAYFSMLSIYFIVLSAVNLSLVLLCKLNAYEKIMSRKKD